MSLTAKPTMETMTDPIISWKKQKRCWGSLLGSEELGRQFPAKGVEWNQALNIGKNSDKMSELSRGKE